MSMFLFLFRVSAKTILSRFLGFLKKNESWDPWIHFPRKWRHSPIGNLKFPHLLWHWDDHPIKLLHLDDFSCVVTSVSKFKLQIIHAMKYFSRCVRWSYTHHLYSELQQAGIFFSPHSLLQNLSTFSDRYVRTSEAASRQGYLLQRQLYFKETSSSCTWLWKALSREIWWRLSPSRGKNYAQKSRYHLLQKHYIYSDNVVG